MSKASKQRPCPALGREISSADCGEQRQSRLVCPADCAHNPFAAANYTQLLEIEERLDGKTLEKLGAMIADRAALGRDLAKAGRQGAHATHAHIVWRLFYATEANNATVAQRWEKSGLTELKNDERVLLRAKMQMRIALLEIHRVFAGGRLEAVDLLSPNPAPMILQERSLAGMATRFSNYLTWVFPLPHYWRLSGTGVTIPDVAQLSAREVVQEIVRHLGGPVTEAEMRRWLAEHFLEFCAAQEAVAQMRRKLMFAGMDAKFGKAVYELRAPFAECRERLDCAPGVEPGDISEEEESEGLAEARDWVEGSPKLKHLTMPGGQTMLGRVLLGQSMWRLEAMGAEKLSRLRRQFEDQMGGRVRFSGERVDDLGAQMTGRGPAVDETLVPPRLLENPEKIALMSSRVPALPPGVSPREAESELLRAAERAFLDEPIPALGNCTPREAARNPARRRELVRLMKSRVRSQDERNLKTGRTDDINWMLHELKLDEILFEAPPWRPPPANEGTDIAERPDYDAEPAVVDPNRPPAPPLPDEPLDFEEGCDRLRAAMDSFVTAAEAEKELQASGATLLEDAERLMLDRMTEADFCFAIPFLLQAWFALVPRGCRAPEIDFDDLEKAFTASLRQLEVCTQSASPKKMELFFQSGPQPGLMLAILGGIIPAANTAPKEIRPTPEAQPLILAFLKTVVEKLDAALRRK